jgi:hypothetical protein
LGCDGCDWNSILTSLSRSSSVSGSLKRSSTSSVSTSAVPTERKKSFGGISRDCFEHGSHALHGGGCDWNSLRLRLLDDGFGYSLFISGTYEYIYTLAGFGDKLR